MKRIIAFLSFCFFALALTAQTALSTVQLYDGSQLTGEITEEKAGEFIKLKTEDGNTLTITFDKIKKLTKNTEALTTPDIVEPQVNPTKVEDQSFVTVSLKDGTQKKGIVVEQLEDAYIKLLQQNGSIITIANNDIDEIIKKEKTEPVADNTPKITTEKSEGTSSNTNFLSAIQDIVYFKDGSRMHGEIIEQKEDEYVKLLTSENNIITIPAELIKKKKEINRKNRKYYEKGRNAKIKGYYNVSMVGSVFGTDELNGRTLGLSFQTINGYLLNRFIGVGGGVSLDFYTYEFIPIFLDIRGYVLDKSISPYYSFNIGYGFGTDLFNRFENNEREIEGGMMMHPSIGVRIATRYNSSFQMDIGYKFQDALITANLPDFTEISDVRYQRFTFRFGWIF